MLYAFGFERVGVVMSDLFFVDPDPGEGQEGAERGVRLEVRLFQQGDPPGSIYASRPIAIDRPLWRADLLEQASGPPASFDRTHHHPAFHGWEPGRRRYEPEMTADPVGWVGRRLSDLETLAAEAGVDLSVLGEHDADDLRAVVPEITDTLQRLLRRVHAGELAMAPAGGSGASERRSWL